MTTRGGERARLSATEDAGRSLSISDEPER